MHQLWFCDGEYVHMAAGAPDFKPTHPLDDQFYRIVDVRNPAKPAEVGRWWLPGTREGDSAPPPARHSPFDKGYRAHNTNVYPQRPDRCYLGYIDAGMVILDISDKSKPKPICRWDNSPPYTGFTHTLLPLFERGLLVVTDESTEDDGADWPKLVWVVDVRDETNPVPIATCPLPPVDAYRNRGGRFGAHNLSREHAGAELVVLRGRSSSAPSSTAACAPTTSSNPYQPKEVAYFVPPAPPLSRAGSIQLNDVFVDERGIVYTVDRFAGGLYILEMDF